MKSKTSNETEVKLTTEEKKLAKAMDELFAKGGWTIPDDAIVGIYASNPKWQERPLACVVPKPGRTLTKADVLAFLREKIAKWQLPEDVAFVEAVPKTSVGKFAKRELRERFKDHCWPS